MQTYKDVGPGPFLKSFFYHVCAPQNDSLVKGCILLLHGAEGHGAMYESFGNELIKHGYALFAIDHVGHGKTALDQEKDLGCWVKQPGKKRKDDFHHSAYNAYYLLDVIRKRFPNKPIYVLGQGYGGAMAQYIVGKFKGSVDGMILSSCGLPTAKDKYMFVKCLIKKIILFDGAYSRFTYKERTAFLNYHFKPNRTKYDWLNSVPEEVDKFIEDPLAGYVCTVGYYYYLYKYLLKVPRIMRWKHVRKSLPILMLSGEEDYINRKGRAVEGLKKFYEKKQFTNITSKEYPKSRHEVLLEWNKKEVVNDICSWMDRLQGLAHTANKIEDKNDIIVIKREINREDNEIEGKSLSFLEESPDDDLRLSTKIENDK